MAVSLDGVVFMFLSFARSKERDQRKERPSGAPASLVPAPLANGGRRVNSRYALGQHAPLVRRLPRGSALPKGFSQPCNQT
jgi:hypothetical protein